jgi:hypothetical protein
MPTLKQAQTPPSNLKDMINLSSAAPAPAQPQMPRPAPMDGRTGLNSLAIGPTPSLLTTAYDNIRQWIRPGAPQFRIAPLPVKANQQSGALAQSAITQSKSSGNTGNQADEVHGLSPYMRYHHQSLISMRLAKLPAAQC